MPDARRTRSLACKNKTKHTSVVTTVTPESPGHSPRNGFNGYLVPRRPGLFATVVRESYLPRT
jgi:hypothetical protein